MSSLITGCSPSANEVEGRYIAKYGNGTDFVDLKADFTYVHYSIAQAIPRQQSGTWEFRRGNGGLQRIHFNDWILYIDPMDAVTEGQTGKKTGFSVYLSNGKLIFYPDYEDYNYYRQ